MRAHTLSVRNVGKMLIPHRTCRAIRCLSRQRHSRQQWKQLRSRPQHRRPQPRLWFPRTSAERPALTESRTRTLIPMCLVHAMAHVSGMSSEIIRQLRKRKCEFAPAGRCNDTRVDQARSVGLQCTMLKMCCFFNIRDFNDIVTCCHGSQK